MLHAQQAQYVGCQVRFCAQAVSGATTAVDCAVTAVAIVTTFQLNVPVHCRLLDDNRQLFVPELQESINPHPHFMLFATQNPPGTASALL